MPAMFGAPGPRHNADYRFTLWEYTLLWPQRLLKVTTTRRMSLKQCNTLWGVCVCIVISSTINLKRLLILPSGDSGTESDSGWVLRNTPRNTTWARRQRPLGPSRHAHHNTRRTRKMMQMNKKCKYTVSQKNPCDYVFDDNLNSKRTIVIIFGTVIT